MSARSLVLCASASLVALIFLCLAWELWIAPLRPGGSWLVLKSVPLLGPVFGVFHGRRYTYQWSSMLILVYLCEGTVRVISEAGASRWLAATEIALAVAFLFSAIAYARMSPAATTERRPPRHARRG